MPFSLYIHKQAAKELLKIKKADLKMFYKINQSIIKLQKDLFFSSLWIKKLQGEYSEFYCVKVGVYRIKFGVEDNIITIYKIEQRKNAYR